MSDPVIDTVMAWSTQADAAKAHGLFAWIIATPGNYDTQVAECIAAWRPRGDDAHE